MAAHCAKQNRDPKGFKCSKYEHKSFKCKERNSESKPLNPGSPAPFQNSVTSRDRKIHVVELDKPHQNMKKLVKIAGIAIEALIDTGSPITAIKENLYRLLGSPP